jgi:uncharacterized protein (UPF0297 family)
MAKTVFDVLLERIRDDADRTKAFMASGGPKDFTQYRETVGVLRGLEVCQQHVEDLAKNYLEDDDD